ncbi:MAG: class I SAM-dependent methyltransferase [Anaerolineae bacterium]
MDHIEGDAQKKLTQERFGTFAEGYVTSSTHAAGEDLELLAAMAQPQPGWRVLDVATGGGHTALRFAPHVGSVVASDLTPRMLETARKFIVEKGAPNMTYVATDGETLSFAANQFDLVTCRIAPHHFPDCFRFVQECARVTKPGGYVLIEDHVLPEDDRAARYIDSFERLRDPSHHRAFAEYEWRGMFLDAGMTVERVEIFSKPGTKFLLWAERQGCTPETIEKLQVMMVQAPEAAKVFMAPQNAGTPEATFTHRYILILGQKRG